MEPTRIFLNRISLKESPPETMIPQRMPSVKKQLPTPPPRIIPVVPQEIQVTEQSSISSPITAIPPTAIPNISAEIPWEEAKIAIEESDYHKDAQEREESIHNEDHNEEIKRDEKPQHHAIEPNVELPRKLKAVLNFEGEDGELSFEKGQTILILKSLDNGQYFGELDGVQGTFPSNYVSEISQTSIQPQKSSVLKPSVSKTITLDFDTVESSANGNTSPSSPTSPTNTEPKPTQSTTRAFSYIPQMPPNGFAGLKKATPSKELLETAESVQAGSIAECKECGCLDYTENVFKRGSCNNCFHIH